MSCQVRRAIFSHGDRIRFMKRILVPISHSLVEGDKGDRGETYFGKNSQDGKIKKGDIFLEVM